MTSTQRRSLPKVEPDFGRFFIGITTQSYDPTKGSSYDQPGRTQPPGTIDDWIQQASLQLPLSDADRAAIKVIAFHESSNDPLIINNNDQNAKDGHASKGLMQVISDTFMTALAQYPGVRDIFDPVDSILAGTVYARGQYGSLENVPGVVAVANGHPYVGY